MEGRPSDLTRRELLKAAGAAAVTVPLVTGNALVAAAVTSAAAPLFFTREQFAMVDELTEIVIPTDEHSGGARSAGVAAYIDGRLAEAVEPERKQRWIEGLARVDALAQEQKGAAFMQLSPDDRLAVVTTMAADEEKRTTVEGKFFSELKRQTAHGYYTSKIGLHDELEYKGNVLQEEYSGTDVSKG